MIRRFLLLLFVCVASVAALSTPVSAHNSLVTSDPVEAATLADAPTQLKLVFSNAVALDTLSIELIDATGVRVDLAGSTISPTADTEVVTPLPALAIGGVTVRWRLVGPDGHPITGTVTFAITSPTPTPAPATEGVADAPADPTQAAVPPVTASPTTSVGAASADFAEPWTAWSGARWLLRFGSYLAIMLIGGVIMTTAFVWDGAWDHPFVQRSISWALAGTLVAAIAQLLVIASDIEGAPPWAAGGGLSAALETDAGRAFAVRAGFIVALAWVMLKARLATEHTRWLMSCGLFAGLLATWAYAGHSRSMRWSPLGVPLDVVHHAAAAAWIGGLAIVGIIAIRECSTEDLVGCVNRFGRVAAISVAVIVGTGVLQALRLVGSPAGLFAANHGRFLIVKLFVLGGMLKIADINRQRVSRRFRSAEMATPNAVYNLQRAMGTEFAVGVLIVAVTAVMVVSPPAVAQVAAVKQTTIPADGPTATSTAEMGPAATMDPSMDMSGTGGQHAADPATPVADAQIGACAVTASTLRLGASGPDVQCLQVALVASGFLEGEATGTFDDATDAAVRTFQAERGLLVDGIVGKITATSLNIWPTV